MNKWSFTYIGITILATISLLSCRDRMVDKEMQMVIERGDKNWSFPFASDEDLNILKTNDHIIDPLLARKQALLDLLQFRELFGRLKNGTARDSFYLADKPIIVYDDEELPKLYEYIVFSGDEPLGTIVTFARKEVTDISACILPFIRNYSSKYSLRFFVTYPYSYLDSQIRAIQKRGEGVAISEDINPELKTIASDSDIRKYWSKLEQHTDRLIAMNDQEFLNSHMVHNLRSEIKEYIIPLFDKENLKRTRFSGSGWCGPAAMAWVYRGFYDHYNGYYIPLHGEISNDAFQLNVDDTHNVSYYDKKNILFSTLAELCNTEKNLVTGTFPNDFDKAVEIIFPTKKIQRHKGEIKGAPRRAIQNGNPIYLVVFTKKGELHYIIGFGTKDKYGLFGLHTNSWILVTDNGTNIQDHNYLPYYRNSNFFNLANKYLYMGEFIDK